MDSLFDSLKIRDLLSARDLTDPTTPLSAPDLRLLITKLESHSLQIKSKVQSYLTLHHTDFFHLFSLCNDAVSHSDVISQTFSNLLESLSNCPVDVEVKELVKLVEETVREARVNKELLDVVRVIVEFKRRLDKVNEEFVRVRDLMFCAKEVRDLKCALRVGEDEDGEPVVYRVLRNEWSDRFDQIQEVLVRFMGDAVRFEEESHRVRVKYRLDVDGSKDGVDLRTVLEAMDVVGILDYGLAKVADLIIKHVITPVVSHGLSVSSVEESSLDIKDTNEAVLEIVACTPKIENTDPEKIFSEITLVVKFIYKCVCFRSSSWIQCFGRLTWPSISDLIISKVLSKIVPKDAKKLVDFEKIIKLTSHFETTLKEMKFISASDNKDERLSNFAENLEIHFAYKKKQELLSKARNLLLKCDFSIPQDDKRMGPTADCVVDLLFLSERCVVSEAASELMKLVHLTLQDACLSSTRVALEFYHAARDAILLYEAIIPVKATRHFMQSDTFLFPLNLDLKRSCLPLPLPFDKLERQLHHVNHVAVLIHNDSLYLSQEILGLAFEYRSYLPSTVQDYAVFVDMSPRFQLMGEEILQRQIQLVISNLKEAIDGADGFQNTHQVQQFESAKFTIDQVVFILEKVRIIWEPLLLPVTYQRSMSIVLESVFSRITKDILILDDIAAEETLQLQRLIHILLENLSSLIDPLVTINQYRKMQDDSAHTLDNLIPSVSKIRKLAELLDMPLKSITESWESGELMGCGFALSEVKDFIRAIFTDSPLRKECLWRIENTSF